MNKIITFFLATICLFSSCTTDIEVNSPALQATKKGELIRAYNKKAYIHEDGTLKIQGDTGLESFSFTIASINTGKYKIGENNTNAASYKNDREKYISENETTDGEVIITNISNNEVSGKFYFKNLKDADGNTLDLMNGWFYRLPLENYTEEELVITVAEENPCLLNASLTASINGTSMITEYHDARTVGVDNVSVIIEGYNDSEEITILFPVDVESGEYNLRGAGEYSATYGPIGEKSSAVSGTLIITGHNKEDKCITGSFEFNTRSGYEVTEGNFDFGY